MILAEIDLTTITVGAGTAGIIGAVLTFALRWRKQSGDQWRDLNDRLTKRIDENERQGNDRERRLRANADESEKRLQKRLDECEGKHKECGDKFNEQKVRGDRLQERVFSLQSQIDKLSSDQVKMDLKIDVKNAVKSAAKDVIAEVSQKRRSTDDPMARG